MIGALFNALLYILVLIKPNKMNQIANYFFGGFAFETREVIYIGLIAIPIILILLSMVPIKLLQLGELKSRSLGLNVQQVMFLILTLASIITKSRDSIYRYYWFHRHDSASTDKTLLLEIYVRHSNDIKYFNRCYNDVDCRLDW